MKNNSKTVGKTTKSVKIDIVGKNNNVNATIEKLLNVGRIIDFDNYNTKKDNVIKKVREMLKGKNLNFRFSLSSVQKLFLDFSKDSKCYINSKDITDIATVIYACGYITLKDNINILPSVNANGVIEFKVVAKNEFYRVKENKLVTEKTETEIFKSCFEKCSEKIDFNNVDKVALKEVVQMLSKYLK